MLPAGERFLPVRCYELRTIREPAATRPRGTHASKTAKRGASSFVKIAEQKNKAGPAPGGIYNDGTVFEIIPPAGALANAS
jgi:hypothetical protein